MRAARALSARLWWRVRLVELYARMALVKVRMAVLRGLIALVERVAPR